MKQAETTVYRICAVSDAKWDVLGGASAQPLATFDDKHTAVAYAMSLARTRSSWQLPATKRNELLGSVLTPGPGSSTKV